MHKRSPTTGPRRLALLIALSWLAMLGFDFFLHAGLLAGLYLAPSPFLLPPLEAFRRIPLGYLSFLLLAILLVWLMVRLRLSGWRAGLIFGLQLGALTWGALVLGLLSIATADAPLLAGWLAGQTLELGLAGAVAGSGLAGTSFRRLLLLVLGFVFTAIVATVTLQTLGLAPAARL
ncbi:MAG: hypothetical protein ACYC4L_19350 [Chloroflexota bacterium]